MSASGSFSGLLAAALLVSFPSVVRGVSYPIATDDSCTCYQTNGSTAAVFANRRLFDFRSLADQAGVPAVLTDIDSNENAPATSSYFTSSDWTSMWQAQTWDNAAVIADPAAYGSDATVLMANTANNIYIESESDGSTHMTMRTARTGSLQSAAELDSVSTGFQYLSVRMEARTIGAPGAVAAMFTYRPPTSDAVVQEADLEILTTDPATNIHYTNQPSLDASTGDSNPDATRNATLPAGYRWTEWATHRIDWTPGLTTWYVNGLVAAQISFQAPQDPALFILNCWSNGGSWSGVMADGDEALLQIRWLDVVFNSTDAAYAAPSGGCQSVCSVDAGKTPTGMTGTPTTTMLTTATTSRVKTTMTTSKVLKTKTTSKMTSKTALTTKTTLKTTTLQTAQHQKPMATTTMKTTTLVASSTSTSETLSEPSATTMSDTTSVSPAAAVAAALHDGKKHLLLAASGSVATIKLPLIAAAFRHVPPDVLAIRVILTPSAAQFLQGQSAEQPRAPHDAFLALPHVEAVYVGDADEWQPAWVRGAAILHIELRRWADLLVVAPLSANLLAKLAHGLCDSLLTCVVRAWDTDPAARKTILVAPSMNTAMWKHPLTARQLRALREAWGGSGTTAADGSALVDGDAANDASETGSSVGTGGSSNSSWYEILLPQSKALACGDVGPGAMADWRDIVLAIRERLELPAEYFPDDGTD